MLSMIIIITCTVSCQYHYCHPLHNYLHDHPHGWHIKFWHNRSTKPQNHHQYKKIFKIIVNQHKSCQSCHDPRLTRPLVSSLLSSMPKLIENHFPSKLYRKMPFIIANAMLIIRHNMRIPKVIWTTLKLKTRYLFISSATLSLLALRKFTNQSGGHNTQDITREVQILNSIYISELRLLKTPGIRVEICTKKKTDLLNLFKIDE